ncbi:exonuclease/endonuclease/phosphatase family protein [Flavobacterium aciduliphilum]|uniref:Endonuclease/exonuclease/phosphatase family protein n=1 Tax=Flavobacterium aciduliphilum TaxID=1101402 RepID=A0A328YKS0_9FLAO|nr:hypothetical protein [Flavobacterium aciduliphilum]RAR73683.1 hypothetical protein CLV55_1031 [Flavobacterium aciduliphilum]
MSRVRKYIFIGALVWSFQFFAQVTVCSWNLMNFGKSKSENTLEFISNTLNPYDIVTIQEVVTGPGGAQKVAELVAILNRKGFQWDYEVSPITTSDNSSSRERYAFIWKASQVKKIGKGWLDQTFEKELDREPFMSTFEYKGKPFTIASFHAVPKKKHPESEIKTLSQKVCKLKSQGFVFIIGVFCQK